MKRTAAVLILILLTAIPALAVTAGDVLGKMTADERAAFAGPAEATLLVEHPNYQAQVRLDAATRKSLIADLQDE